MKKSTKLIIEISLFVVIVIMAYVVFNSVDKNIYFENEKNRKQELAVNKLVKIRELQLLYESKYSKFCDSWSELEKFVLTDSLEFDYREGDMEDSVAVAEGRAFVKKVKRPAVEKLIADGIISGKNELLQLKYVPESDSLFSIASSSIVAGGIKLSTFQVGVSWNVLLEGLDRQLIINANEVSEMRTKYKGLRIGRIDEASFEGNW